VLLSLTKQREFVPFTELEIMRRLFKVGDDRHSKGEVIFSWHPEGNFLASAGKNGK
jgi:hypothetical protein